MKDYGIIFDLDGTLLNTLEDLADSVNSVLSRKGWPEHPIGAYRYFVGDGLPMLIRRALPQEVMDQLVIDELILEVRREYSRRWARKTAPYPGVLMALENLADKGALMAVLSNKPHEATCKMVDHFFPGSYFILVRGALPGKAVKPDPGPAMDIARSMGLDVRQVYLLGDSNVDMYTAGAAGMIGLGAAWGFRDREELLQAGAHHILENPLDLLEFFETGQQFNQC